MRIYSQRLVSLTVAALLPAVAGMIIEPGAGFAQTRAPYDAEVQRIRFYMDGKNYDAARPLVRAYLKVHPQSALAHFYSAACLIDKAKLKEALAELQAAEKLDPRAVEIYVEKAQVYANMKQPEKSIEAATKAIYLSKAKPDRNIFHLRSMMYNATGQYKKAIDDMTACINIEPKKARSYMWRANAYEADGQLEKALADFTKAYSLEHNYEFKFHRSRVLQRLGRIPAAIADLTDIVKENPEEDDAWNRRGNLYFAIGKYKEAVNDYTQALETNFGAGETIYRARAKAYEKLGQHSMAQKDLKKADELFRKPVVEPI